MLFHSKSSLMSFSQYSKYTPVYVVSDLGIVKKAITPTGIMEQKAVDINISK